LCYTRLVTEVDWDGVRAAAVAAAGSAYAPYSRLSVGAAALCDDGRVVTGCNVENASYGLTLCAERVAVFKAISEGIRGFDAVAVVADSPRLAPPCGPCRQILWEFCGDVWVHLEDLKGHRRTMRMSKLLPLPFDDRNL
jgi:cytidine deaminase